MASPTENWRTRPHSPARRAAEGTSAIFKDKQGGDRIQGTITKVGSQRFEAARRRLARLANREVERTSDADTVEYLARGEAATIAYLSQ